MNLDLLIRADATEDTGWGHVMRCLALAQRWQEKGGRATFVISEDSSAIKPRLVSEGVEVLSLFSVKKGKGEDEDARETAKIAHEKGASWVCADGYQFDGQFQKIIRDSHLNLLFIDDYGHAEHYYANRVLNQNIHAHERLYSNRESYTELLLGTSYVLLRHEFSKWGGWSRSIAEKANKILVTLGGRDPLNVTSKVIDALGQVQNRSLDVRVVLGESNPCFAEVREKIQGFPFSIRLESKNPDMAELMAWADVAISAGGSTCWELAFMGLPSLMIILSDNQHPIVEGLGRAGIGINLGQYETLSISKMMENLDVLMNNQALRIGMSERGRKLVDGKGAARVAEILLKEKILK